MTREMNWTNIEVKGVRPICLFDVCNNDELKEAFCWKKTRTLLRKVHQQKRIIINFFYIINYNFLKHINLSK